jgi:hypothetical protein
MAAIPVGATRRREFAGLACIDRKPAVDELRSRSRPIAVYAIEVA